jgi:hypothetical protein
MLKFYCIGAQKSGTTWLYEKLQQHPDVHFPHGKEIHFWDKKFQLGLEWYKGLFSDAKTQGDMTPAYAVLPVETIRSVYNAFPDLKLVYTIRNPIDRAWSSAKMALARAEMTLPEASDQWFIDHFNSSGSLARGDYQNCIENWRRVFPDDSLAVFRYEHMTVNPKLFLCEICRHIGVNTNWIDGLDDWSLRTPTFQSTPSQIRESLKPELQRLYSDKIKRLSDYLSDDFTNWLC